MEEESRKTLRCNEPILGHAQPLLWTSSGNLGSIFPWAASPSPSPREAAASRPVPRMLSGVTARTQHSKIAQMEVN